MTSGPLITQQLLPQVALPFMNGVHSEELALVTRLLTQVQQKAISGNIDSLFQEWIAHTQAHFAREERLMETWGFPPYPIHKSAHTEALSELLQAQERWLQQRDYKSLGNYILDDWQSWLQQHISTMDFVTANFLSRFDIEVDI